MSTPDGGISPEEAMWFVGGTGIQTEGEIEDICTNDETNDTEVAILVAISIILIVSYILVEVLL